MIRIGGLFPRHLNLNGDFGNLEVIMQQAKWRGVSIEVIDIEITEQLDSSIDFMFVGHGSQAAWAQIEDEFTRMAPQLRELMSSGLPGLAVSSGFERMTELELFSDLNPRPSNERVSKFEIYPDGDSEVLGYLNTDTSLPVLHRQGNWIGTLLHGPVLSRNPALLEEVLQKVSTKSNVAIPALPESEKARQLADLVSEIWKLERDLASE